MLKFFTINRLVILVFSLYLAIGLFIAKDYGTYTDAITERETSLSNYVYVMGKNMLISKNENVRNIADNTTALMDWEHRFHGVALQNITVFIEHLMGFEMPLRDVFLLRHIFTFLNYFIGGIFFFLILRRRFGNSFIPLMGVLLYILYPRFFGDSFYSIKDILFFSWYIISVYFTLRWLEEERNSFISLVCAAATLAIATNARILGISVLLLACVFSVVLGIRRKLDFDQIVKKPLMLIVLTFVCYVVITPLTWENPIKNTIDTFFHFLHFQPWNGTHFYMGEMITREVPWHYIPVWMGLTVPLFYIIMFFVGTIRRPAHLFDVFFIALFFCTLFGFIGLHISMYGGWRHVYCIYASFLYVAVLGLERSFAFLRDKRPAIKRGFACFVAAYLICLFAWIVVNHPYQYVYFNLLGRQFAEKNFELDGCVSTIDLTRYALANDDKPKITFAARTTTSKNLLLTESEKERAGWANRQEVDYYLQDTHIAYEDRLHNAGYVEAAAITVDGMKISRLLKRVQPSGEFSDDAPYKIKQFESNADDDYETMYDGDYNTKWSTNRPQKPGDYMMFEFDEDVNYNYLFLGLNRLYFGDYPRDLSVYVSDDGSAWQKIPVTVTASVYYKLETKPYRFLKLENNGSDSHLWSVSEMKFGYAL